MSFRSAIARMVQSRLGTRNIGPPRGFFATPPLSGVMVTPETSLTLTAAYAAVNVLSTDLASMGIQVCRRLPDGTKTPAIGDRRNELLRGSHNGDAPAIRMRQALMGHVLGWGNGYAEIVRDGGGWPDAIHLLSPRPQDTKPERLKSGRLVYRLSNGKQLLAEDVIHVAGLGWDGLSGYSPVAMARQAIGLGLAAEQFGAALFGNGATPRGFLKTPHKLSKEAAARLREQFEAVHQGTINAHRTAVLEEGLEWTPTTINPDDAQFLETRKFQVIEIARMYRVPPNKLCDYSQAHLANLEQSNIDYLTTSLMPWAIAIEAELNLKLFSTAERQTLFVEHDLTNLLRGDMAARGAYYKQMFDMGVYSVNDIRKLENMNPIQDGDKHFVPLALTTLDCAGQPDPKAMGTRDGTLSAAA